jgi:hypothetical protein
MACPWAGTPQCLPGVLTINLGVPHRVRTKTICTRLAPQNMQRVVNLFDENHEGDMREGIPLLPNRDGNLSQKRPTKSNWWPQRGTRELT